MWHLLCLFDIKQFTLSHQVSSSSCHISVELFNFVRWLSEVIYAECILQRTRGLFSYRWLNGYKVEVIQNDPQHCDLSDMWLWLFARKLNYCVSDNVSCEPNPCENGGQCHEDVNTIVCVCPVGTIGERCSNESKSLWFVETQFFVDLRISTQFALCRGISNFPGNSAELLLIVPKW